MKSYQRKAEWCGYTVRPTRAGWIVESWSAIQGEWTNRRVLVRPCLGLDPSADLAAPWNDWMSIGDAIAGVAKEAPDRILRRGARVA